MIKFHIDDILLFNAGRVFLQFVKKVEYMVQLNTTKMAYSGYETDRFVGIQHEGFLCLFCLNVAKDPYQCSGCGKLVCKVCITSWTNTNPQFKCPNRCRNIQIKPVTSKALLRIYKDLNIKCSSKTCNKVLKLSDLTQHEATCLVSKCWNFDVCQKPYDKDVKSNRPCCSQVCNVLITIKDKLSDRKLVYDCLGGFIKGVQSNPLSYIANPKSGSSGNISIVNNSLIVSAVGWDPIKAGGGITITENGIQCFLKEQSYLFRTTLAVQGFTSGVHYWQIIADGRTQNQLKIGVVTDKNFDYNSAFCDHPFGFAYYGLGQLRHNSNASGPSYGKKFKKQGILGVCLNMNTGVLGFSLNGEYMGVAYKDAKLTSGPIYPAVALLHCAGCKIKSGLPVPSFFKD